MVVPIDEVEVQIQEQGAIRIGHKTARAMEAIDKFRFTSADHTAIHQIAALYGAKIGPRVWKERPDELEVYTDADEIDIWLPPGGLSVGYELWSGKGLERRCDGVECFVRKGSTMVQAPCVCEDKGQQLCRYQLRLRVILPNVRFGGVWMLRSKSENAVREMRGMDQMMRMAESNRRVPLDGVLALEKRQSREQKGKHYVVPVIRPKVTVGEMLAGASNPLAIAAESSKVPTLGALPTPTSEEDDVKPAEWKERIEAKFGDDAGPRDRVLAFCAQVVKQFPVVGDDHKFADWLAARITGDKEATLQTLDDSQCERAVKGCLMILDGKADVRRDDDGTLRIVNRS